MIKTYTKLVIEHGIPIPPTGNRVGITDALREMLPGDSFLIDLKQRYIVTSCAQKIGIKITCRNIEGKLRVWRLEQ